MELNKQKTKILVCNKNPLVRTNITIGNEVLQKIDEFKYLGSIVTKDGRCNREITSRIAQAKNAFNKKKSLLSSKSISLETRKRLLKTYVWSIALYGSESWTFGNVETKKLEAFELWCYRRILKIKWTERITNEDVLKRVNENKSFLQGLKKRRAIFVGHNLRHDGPVKRIIEGQTEGRNCRGRPRLDYVKQVLKDMNCSSYYELKRKAEKRAEWRAAANQPNGC